MLRRVNDNKNFIRSNRRRLDDANDQSWAPWAKLKRDLLFVILMHLGSIDFFSFSRVCRSWRAVALSHKEYFMSCKEPLLMITPPICSRGCTLFNLFDRRRFATLLPQHTTGWEFVGLSCGYLIYFGKKTAEFWLVNPFTRHEFHFPALPKYISFYVGQFRAILVYSTLISEFLLVFILRTQKRLFLSRPGDNEWSIFRYTDGVWDIVDLSFFNGRIYVLYGDGSIGQMRLNPLPTLQRLNIKIAPYFCPHSVQLVCSRKQLFVVDGMYTMYHVNFDRQEWVEMDSLGESAVFMGDLKCSALVDASKWGDHGKCHGNKRYFLTHPAITWGTPECFQVDSYKEEEQGRILSLNNMTPNLSSIDMWYFPHEAYMRNVLSHSA